MLKLNIIQNEYYIIKRGNIEDPVKAASFKYQYHPSTTHIDDIMKLKNIFFFSFQPFLIDKVKDIIKILNNKRYCPDGDITVKLLKINQGIFSRLIFQNFNQSLVSGEFPHCLKEAKVIPVFKEEEKPDKSKYRPASILQVISNIYERLMYDQMHKHFDRIFSKFQCGFRKGFSTKDCLLYMIENRKESLDQEGALSIDLSKAFDCIMHNLLIAKLQTYIFDNDALNFICNYLLGSEQRIKLNSFFNIMIKNRKFCIPGIHTGAFTFQYEYITCFETCL